MESLLLWQVLVLLDAITNTLNYEEHVVDKETLKITANTCMSYIIGEESGPVKTGPARPVPLSQDILY